MRNPAFDVTPAELVWGLVTERGVARPVTAETVAYLRELAQSGARLHGASDPSFMTICVLRD